MAAGSFRTVIDTSPAAVKAVVTVAAEWGKVVHQHWTLEVRH